MEKVILQFNIWIKKMVNKQFQHTDSDFDLPISVTSNDKSFQLLDMKNLNPNVIRHISKYVEKGGKYGGKSRRKSCGGRYGGKTKTKTKKKVKK